MKRILDPIRIEFIDGRRWRLLEDFRFYLGGPDGSECVVVAAGFTTDFASIPRVFWRVFPPHGRYSPAALVHDRLYVAPAIQCQQDDGSPMVRVCDRAKADAIFLEAMTVVGVNWLTRRLLYRAVRLGGWLAWKGYRRQ